MYVWTVAGLGGMQKCVPLFFCLLGFRLLFGETGFFGFLFGLLPFQPHLLVKIGLQQHASWPQITEPALCPSAYAASTLPPGP